MGAKEPQEMMKDNLLKIEALGFQKVGFWKLAASELQCIISQPSAQRCALYAFVANGEVFYIGKTLGTLFQRMKGYENPGPTQTTNIRINRLLLNCISNGFSFEIYALFDNGLLNYGGFTISLPGGLEDSLISDIQPHWNMLGKGRQVPQKSQLPKTTPLNQGAIFPKDRLADNIRKFAFETFLKPEFQKGETSVTIRTGDIHKSMNLESRHPAVCSALESKRFCEEFGLVKVSRSGPKHGANVFIKFSIAENA